MVRDWGREREILSKFSYMMFCAKPLCCSLKKQAVKSTWSPYHTAGSRQHREGQLLKAPEPGWHPTASSHQGDSITILKMKVSKVNLQLKPLVQRFWVHVAA